VEVLPLVLKIKNKLKQQQEFPAAALTLPNYLIN